MNAEANQVLDALAADAGILQRLDVRRRGSVNAHAHQIVDGDILVAGARQVAHELWRDAVDARTDDVVEREVGIAGLRQAADVRDGDVDDREPDDVVGGEALVTGSGHVVHESLILRERVSAAAAALIERSVEAEGAGLARPGELDVAGHVGHGGGRKPRKVAETHAETPPAVAGAGAQVELHTRLAVITPPCAASVGRPFAPGRRRRRLKGQGRREFFQGRRRRRKLTSQRPSVKRHDPHREHGSADGRRDENCER